MKLYVQEMRRTVELPAGLYNLEQIWRENEPASKCEKNLRTLAPSLLPWDQRALGRTL